MSILRTIAVSETLADRRTSASILATIALPVAAVTSVIAPTLAAADVSVRSLPIGLVADPLVALLLAGVASFMFAVARSSFAAAVVARRTRYQTIATLGGRNNHFRKLLLWECGIPTAAGIFSGIAIAAVGLAVTDALNNASWVDGLPPASILVALPAIIGAAAATIPTARGLTDPKEPTTIPRVREQVAQPARTAVRLGLASLALIIVSAVSWTRPWVWTQPSGTVGDLLRGALGLIEPFAWLGLTLGVIGTFASATMVVPWLLWRLSERPTDRSERRVALRNLASHPERTAGFTGAVLVLTGLATMAAAGILSDAEQYDNAGDRRQAVISGAFSQHVDVIRAQAADAGNPVVGVARVRYDSGEVDAGFLHAHTDEEVHGRNLHTPVALLTPELADALELSAEDVTFAARGGVLVDSDLITKVHTCTECDTVEIRQVRRGGGLGQPGPVIFISPEQNSSTISPQTEFLIRFEQPITPDLASRLADSPVWIQLPRTGPSDDAVRLTITAIAAALVFSLGLAASNLFAAALDHELSVHVALGASPSLRPRLLATQVGTQLLVGTALGAGTGVLLFWLVTRGDPTVPSAIFPTSTILALAAAAALSTITVRVMHGSASPAFSSRTPTTALR